MSLKVRLFVIFGSLIAILLIAQWWMLKALTTNLHREMDDVAFSIGRDMASTFAVSRGETGASQNVHHILDEEHVNIQSQDHGHTDDPESSAKTKSRQSFEAKFVIKNIEVGDDNKEFFSWISATSDQVSEKSNVVVFKTRSNAGDQNHPRAENKVRKYRFNHGPLPESVSLMDGLSGKLVETHERIHISIDRDENADYLMMAGPSFKKKIPIPKSGVSATLAGLSNRYFLGSMGILGLGLLLVAMASHRFASPLQQLAATAHQVGEGKLGLQIENGSQGGEVGIAIGAFNKMSTRLKEFDAHAQTMRQKQNLTELGEIANGLAHTIRNPLNTLGLSLEQMVALAPKNPEQSELTHIARQQIRRIDQWIRSFLALASQDQVKKEPIRLDSLINDVALEAIQDGGTKVDVNLSMDPNLPIFPAVGPELRAVFQALVVNAVEASQEGSRVDIAATTLDDGTLQVTVADEGPGLADHVRNKLFTPHVTTKETGSGMGLFLANRIVTTRYGGSISFEKNVPQGTRVVVRLPVTAEARGE